MSPVKKTDWELAQDHKYVAAPGRKPAPGVTTIIGILDKPGLQWGASKLTAQIAVLEADQRPKHVYEHSKRKPLLASNDEIYVDFLRTEFDRRWKAKAALGTRVHDHVEDWTQGRDIDELPDERPYLDAAERFIEECKPEWLFVEKILLHPAPNGLVVLEFGGRTDAGAILHGGPKQGPRFVDWKTGNAYLEALALQFAGYGGAEGFGIYDETGTLAGYEPLPKVDGYLGVYLHDDGTYALKDPFERISFEGAWDTFLHLRAALNWRREIEAAEKADKKEAKEAA